MQWFAQWISSLGTLIIILALLRMLLPSGSLRKIAETVLGLTLLMTLIQPLTQAWDIRAAETVSVNFNSLYHRQQIERILKAAGVTGRAEVTLKDGAIQSMEIFVQDANQEALDGISGVLAGIYDVSDKQISITVGGQNE